MKTELRALAYGCVVDSRYLGRTFAPSMKAVTVRPSGRPKSKVRVRTRSTDANAGKFTAKKWSPPDFSQRLREDFGGKIMPFSYVDFLDR